MSARLEITTNITIIVWSRLNDIIQFYTGKQFYKILFILKVLKLHRYINNIISMSQYIPSSLRAINDIYTNKYFHT